MFFPCFSSGIGIGVQILRINIDPLLPIPISIGRKPHHRTSWDRIAGDGCTHYTDSHYIAYSQLQEQRTLLPFSIKLKFQKNCPLKISIFKKNQFRNRVLKKRPNYRSFFTLQKCEKNILFDPEFLKIKNGNSYTKKNQICFCVNCHLVSPKKNHE